MKLRVAVVTAAAAIATLLGTAAAQASGDNWQYQGLYTTEDCVAAADDYQSSGYEAFCSPIGDGLAELYVSDPATIENSPLDESGTDPIDDAPRGGGAGGYGY